MSTALGKARRRKKHVHADLFIEIFKVQLARDRVLYALYGYSITSCAMISVKLGVLSSGETAILSIIRARSQGRMQAPNTNTDLHVFFPSQIIRL
jgi:hypothetical protein